MISLAYKYTNKSDHLDDDTGIEKDFNPRGGGPGDYQLDKKANLNWVGLGWGNFNGNFKLNYNFNLQLSPATPARLSTLNLPPSHP